MGRIEKTVFISYRRTNYWTALAVYQDLTAHNFDVFMDIENIRSGDFEEIIFENIEARAHFLVILSPSALERCNEPKDLLRREIEKAFDVERNIVPLMMDCFDFGSPTIIQTLTGKLALLSQKNGLRIVPDFFHEAMDRLCNDYLNVAVKDINLRQLSTEFKDVTEVQRELADKADPVEKAQLAADKWFEQAIILMGNSSILKYENEKIIECFKRTIQLNPNHAPAYYGRGIVLGLNDDARGAIRDFSEAIRLDPNEVPPYNSRGASFRRIGDFDNAIKDYTKAIYLEPHDTTAYYRRGLACEMKGDLFRAIEDYQKYIDLGGGAEGDQVNIKKKAVELKTRLLRSDSR